jgi:hypothetical protein
MNQLESSEFKKKLKQEIKGYIELRDSIRKFKVVDGKEKRSKSERKNELKAKSEKKEVRH